MYRPKNLAVALMGLISAAGAMMAESQHENRKPSGRDWNQPRMSRLRAGAHGKNTVSQKKRRIRERQARGH